LQTLLPLLPVAPQSANDVNVLTWWVLLLGGLTRKFLPMGLGRPSDIADAALFLASKEAAYITGFVL